MNNCNNRRKSGGEVGGEVGGEKSGVTSSFVT